MKTRVARPMSRLTALKALFQRFSFLLLLLASIALMMVGRVNPLMVENSRARVTDAFVPILDVISRPAATAAHLVERFIEATETYRENKQLRVENARLLQWKQAALHLEAENTSLRNLLHYKPEPKASFISARVIAAPGGAFVRNVVVTAGRREGVRRGQAAVAGPGMIGRVVEVGEWSARVLLITDINTRVPVVLDSSRQRAVLVGDNSDQPQLLYLPPEAKVAVGDRAVTSGDGGLFPPGLPIGLVSSVNDRLIRIQPMVNLSRLEHVQLVDFGLPVGLVSEAERVSDLK
ncbi:MAG: rod shape-determining protein MreC [Rhodospirillaceae bacterium]